MLLVGLLCAVGLSHWSALAGMVALWNGTPMYSFGYIVPFVGAYLAWTQRAFLRALPPTPALVLGILVLLAGLGLLWGGNLAGVLIAEQIAFLFALVGVVLVLFGIDFLRRTWMALAYLLLMIPFWDAFTEPLHQPFQQFSARVGVSMLQLGGIPAYHEGVRLFLPNVTLEVARACSGVNYVVAVLALGVPLGYLYLPSLWRRLVLVASAVVIAALSNSLRVALIGLLSYWEIGSPLHGPFHVLHGLFVSGIGYVVLFAGLRVLTPTGGVPPLQDNVPSAPGSAAPWRAFSTGLALAMSAFFLVAGLVPALYRVTPVPLVRPLDSLPIRLGAWTVSGTPEGEARWWAGADNLLARRYSNGAGAADVWIGYFAAQRQGKELVSHRIDPLYRASTGVRTRAGGGSLDTNVVRLVDHGRDRVGVFWYEIDGRRVTGRLQAKWLTLWNSALRRRSNGMVIVILFNGNEGQRGERELAESMELGDLVHAALTSVEPGA